MNRLLLLASLAIGSASVIAACGSGGTPSGFGGGDDAGGDDTDGSVPGDDGGSFDGNFSSDGGGACGRTCSSDLHSVIDCNNKVISTCADDQGCAAGACVAACDAAKANKSTVGCDYYTIVPDAYSLDDGDCFAAFIANTWGSPITVSVERGGTMFSGSSFARIPSGTGQATTYAPLSNGQIMPGQVAIVFLAGTSTAPVTCPAGITPAFSASDAAIHGTGIGNTAFHVVTSAPVVAYDIYPYGGGNSAITSATLLLPTPAWDTNYIAVDGYSSGGIASFAPWVAIVASEDTDVTLSPTAAIVGGTGVAATGAGVPHTYSITKGQVLQFTQTAELIGTPIQSTKPIGVFGGITCMDVPAGSSACDAAHQQIPPVKALGHEYVGVRQRDRYAGIVESPPFRLVGAVDGTTLTYTPSAPTGAPTTIASGQVVEFRTSSPFVVKSQDDMHPFYMAGYMTGCQAYAPDLSDCRGDPEFVNVIPPQQYLASYVFFTDPTYPETELVFVRKATMGAFEDVTLDCAGVLTGWQALGTDYEWTRVPLVSGNFAKQGMCDNGRHEAHSNAAFGLTVWGWGSLASGGTYRVPGNGFYSQAVSYAYPAGASIQQITTVVVPPMPR